MNIYVCVWVRTSMSSHLRVYATGCCWVKWIARQRKDRKNHCIQTHTFIRSYTTTQIHTHELNQHIHNSWKSSRRATTFLISSYTEMCVFVLDIILFETFCRVLSVEWMMSHWLHVIRTFCEFELNDFSVSVLKCDQRIVFRASIVWARTFISKVGKIFYNANVGILIVIGNCVQT